MVSSCTKQKILSYTVGCKLKVLNTVTGVERRFGPPANEEEVRECEDEDKELQTFEKRAV
jgi:hypothetical protein